MFAISTVECETGLTKDMLRKWEVRFGFPCPIRKPNGERYYSQAELDRLMVIKRLMDSGLRPARIVPLPLEELNALASELSPGMPLGLKAGLPDQVWQAMQSHDPSAMRSAMERAIFAGGLCKFVLATMPALNRMVGDGWANGSLAIHQEHLYSEIIRGVLQETLGRLAPLPGCPSVILTTPPEERHDLGMLMLQSVLAVSGARCISLGTETPGNELVKAAVAHRADIVAVSISVAFPKRRILPFLEQLRSDLPDGIRLWAGGAGMDGIQRQLAGVSTFPSLEHAASALGSLLQPV